MTTEIKPVAWMVSDGHGFRSLTFDKVGAGLWSASDHDITSLYTADALAAARNAGAKEMELRLAAKVQTYMAKKEAWEAAESGRTAAAIAAARNAALDEAIHVCGEWYASEARLCRINGQHYARGMDVASAIEDAIRALKDRP